MDAQGHFFNPVCRFCKQRTSRRVFAIKGKGGFDTPYHGRPSTNNEVKAPLFILGVDTGKSLLYQRLAIEEEGPNYCHFPKEEDRGYTLEYFHGLTAEKLIITYKKGVKRFAWVIRDAAHRRNEPLDVRNYATAALEIINPTLKKPEKNNPRVVL